MTVAQVAQSSLADSTPGRHVGNFYLRATLLVILIFAAIAPTLQILNFSNGSEGLNVATAQEMHRTGEWLIPTLQGKTRLAKPPLTAWLTAICVTKPTLLAISSADPAIRDAGFKRLAWETRWLMLVAGCITLLLTAELGRLVAGEQCGITALIVAATSLLFLRFIRYSSTDVLLMLFVAGANVCIAHAVLRGRRWGGCIGAGVVLALAMLSKGPVALVQSVIPIGLWMLWDRSHSRQSRWPGIGPVLTATAIFLALGSSWFVMVYLREPRAISIWISEVTREGATDAEPDPIYKYISLFPLMLPWMLFLFTGALYAYRKRAEIEILPLILLAAPIAIMSLAKDKPERYLLPMLPAAAVVIAMGLTMAARVRQIVVGHWIILGFFAIGFPIAAIFLKPPWATPAIAGIFAVGGALASCAGIAAQRITGSALIYTTLVVMLGVQVLFVSGYRNTGPGKAELRPLSETIATYYPTAKVWNGHPTGKRPPPEVGVYLNRTIEEAPDHDAFKIQRSSVPQIVLFRQNKGEPDPAMPPPWQFIIKAPRDSTWWWGFVLPPE